MDSSASTLVLPPPSVLKTPTEEPVFDISLLQKQPNLPAQFLWPREDTYFAQEQLHDPPVDLKGFLDGDQEATDLAARQIKNACLSHGFFQVINHGVDASVIEAMHRHTDTFFNLHVSKKMALLRKPGALFGYSGAHADRFSSNLPWKETFSFIYEHADGPGHDLVDYITSGLGQDFEEAGRVYQKYCEEMKKLSLVIMELLAISLGVEQLHFREFFQDGCSILRLNNYPPHKEAGLTLGTGPHCDPTSLTILHQDNVGGLEIFLDNKWIAIPPFPDSFVVNIGDTFMALSNGKYKSCLHRAVVNKERVRRSFAFFMNPRDDKTVRPPPNLVRRQEARQYPDFTWSDLREFTQNHYRADANTLQKFVRLARAPRKQRGFYLRCLMCYVKSSFLN
ncbi:gibberellin 20 oxidase 1-B-like [Sesamum indicum]|uniref:Gibberellin 20 oxidase 1-B-like n=1 Tax=Sesamum indicum TaxID=4182 RepID=A0A6I9UHL5_SESIN|nr:gibberellin 20 oxidase 1-B-like [Sesamum indicum]